MDDLARKGALAIAAARIGIGIGASFATEPALKALRLGEPGPEAVVLARIAGGRDIAMGITALAAANSPPRLREAAAIGALVDLGDAVAFGAGVASGELPRLTGTLNAALALSATVAGAWVVSRLS